MKLDKYQQKALRLLKDNDVISLTSQINIRNYQKLIEILIKHNVLNDYIVYRKEWIGSQNLKKVPFFSNISSAFRWADTKEGHEFWLKISEIYDFENCIF